MERAELIEKREKTYKRFQKEWPLDEERCIIQIISDLKELTEKPAVFPKNNTDDNTHTVIDEFWTRTDVWKNVNLQEHPVEKQVEEIMKNFSHDTAYTKIAIFGILEKHLTQKD